MSKARGLADLGNVYSDGALSNRNLVINGAMQVAQRGTSGGVTTSYTYMLDRWLANGGITSWAQTGAQKSVLQVVTQAGTGPAQRIESNGANFVSGNTYTLSFQVNPTIADVTVGVTFRNGNSYLSEIVAVTDVSSQVVAGSYSTVTYTFTLSSSADIATYPSHNMQVFIGSSVVNTLNITGVQLEVGDTATPFEHRSYGQELALCQRYYYQVSNDEVGGVSTRYGYGHAISTVIAKIVIPIYAQLRTKPTISYSNVPILSDATVGTIVTAIALEGGTSNSKTVCLSVNVASGLTQFRPYWLEGGGGASSIIKIDAEL